MKRLLIGAAGLALLLTGCPELTATNGKACVSKKYSPAEIFQKATPSIVVIAVGESLGSGFVIKQDKRFTYILTNSHVVDGADEVKVKWSDDREETGKVISDHGGETWQKDLALVRVDAVRGTPLKFKETPPAVGEDVVVIGAPQGLEFSLSRGVMSQLRNNGDFLQVDAPVNPGNSGGPLFDKTGCVVGVVTFKDEDSEGINFAIGYGPTKHFLENPAIERPEPKPEPVASEPQPEQQQQQTGWVTYYTKTFNGKDLTHDQVLMESFEQQGSKVYFRWRSISANPSANSETEESMKRLLGQYEEGDRSMADCGNYLWVREFYIGDRTSEVTWQKSRGLWRTVPPNPDVDYASEGFKSLQENWDRLFKGVCNL